MENITSPPSLESIRRQGPGEKIFGMVAKGFMIAANPFKKFAFRTPCLMHRFINIQAVHILENEGYINAADFYREMIKPLNEGATWIDQDFKSTNHFYHFERHKGLYGFSDSLTESMKYKEKIRKHIKEGNLTRALFYAGVICHLTQDMTVPQHVNNKLLESHRDYEVWILSKAWDEIDFSVSRGIIRYPRFEHYISQNSLIANSLYRFSGKMDDKEEDYRFLSERLIAHAQRATAGLLLDFYEAFFKDLDTHIEGNLKTWGKAEDHMEIGTGMLTKILETDDKYRKLKGEITVVPDISPIPENGMETTAENIGRTLEEVRELIGLHPEEELSLKESEKAEENLQTGKSEINEETEEKEQVK